MWTLGEGNRVMETSLAQLREGKRKERAGLLLSCWDMGSWGGIKGGGWKEGGREGGKDHSDKAVVFGGQTLSA